MRLRPAPISVPEATAVLLGVCALVFWLGIIETLGRLLGEQTLYFALGLALTFLGAARAVHRYGTPEPRHLLGIFPVMALVGAFAPVALFMVTAATIRLRTAYLTQIYTELGESADALAVIKRFDSLTWKAAISSTLPTLLAAITLLVVFGVLVGMAGSALAAWLQGRGARRKPRALAELGGYGALATCALFSIVAVSRLTAFQIAFGAGLVSMLALIPVLRTIGTRRNVAEWAIFTGVFCASLYGAGKLERAIDRQLFYEGPDTQVARSFRTPRQKIDLVRARGGAELSLYRNHYLQFTHSETDAVQFLSGDGHHGVMVHAAMALHSGPANVLVLGGADGLSLRELTKYPSLRAMDFAEGDEAWVRFCREDGEMKRIHGGALDDPRVRWLPVDPLRLATLNLRDRYDIIIKDFPEGIGRELTASLSVQYLTALRHRLNRGGILSLHSDYYGTASYWTIVRTLRAAGFTHVMTANDNFGKPDALEGILLASDEPLDFSRLARSPFAKALIEQGVLPPVEGLVHDSDPRFHDYQMDVAGARVSSLYRPTYARALREENGFVLPLAFAIGVY